MQLEIGKSYFGFKLIEEKEVKELNSKTRNFIHEKSGARLFHIENDDDNKVFSIGFKTPPKDSTGVAHILEHSVLCGSRKFPVKEPFIELLKGSLNTFLNAMTFADKTMYPVASKNEKDFLNLMDVYMDAVLYPNIYDNPEIMMQEGWHYELENKEDEISYKGVVYNEMKGAFSSPESILMRKVSESLFPDTIYGVESGGDPEDIPNLTQSQFEEFHRKYYHPSNSFIFLYGDMDILEKLEFLNEEYLKDFNKIKVDSEISLQEPFKKQKEHIVEYPISPNEKEENKTFLSMNFVVSKSIDKEMYLAFEILEYLLLENSAAPLKKALLDANIGEDVFGLYDNSILQPTFSIVVKNSNIDKKEEFKKIVYDTLESLSKEGIDKKLVESSINIREFSLREADFAGYPKGLIYAIKCMDSWLYGEDPKMHLEYEVTLEKIKKYSTENYFENIIEKYILNNSHSSILIVKPSKTLAEKKEQETRKKLSDYKESLSNEEIENIILNTKNLKERQSAPDNPEDLKTIPLLDIKDIEPKAEDIPLDVIEEDKFNVLYYEEFTNNIDYLDLYFDTSSVEEDLLPYITLLAAVLGKVDTENYSYEDLSKEINLHTGGIGTSIRTFIESDNDKIYYPKFLVRSKALLNKSMYQMELLDEIINKSKFDDKKRLKEIIMETKSKLEMKIINEGNAVAAARVISYFSPSAQYVETTCGLNFYKFLINLDKNFDDKYEEIVKNLENVSKSIFDKKNIIVSLTTEDKGYSKIIKEIPVVYDNLNDGNIEVQKYSFKELKSNEGLATSAKVQYVAKAYNFKRLGYEYTGTLQVLKTIASFDYLWNNVRVQGGAYGCSASFSRSGNIFLTSYRDPNLLETINVYDNLANYIENFNADKREMTKYIIGTISNLDTVLTPSMKGQRATANYFKNLKYEDIQKEREEVLNTTVEDIRNCADLVRDSMNQNYICVLGNEVKINDNKNIFNDIVNIFE